MSKLEFRKVEFYKKLKSVKVKWKFRSKKILIVEGYLCLCSTTWQSLALDLTTEKR